MTKISKYTKLLNTLEEWEEEYLSGYIYFREIVFSDLGSNLLGNCHREGRTYLLQINKRFENDYITSYVILWHEFAHMMNVLVNKQSGHGAGWLKCWFKKPLLTIPAYIIIFPNVIRRLIK